MKTNKLNDLTEKNDELEYNQGEENSSKEGFISKIKQKILGMIKIPESKSLGHLTYVEVLGLMKAEEGLDLYPLDMYQGVIKGNLHYKKKIPMMKRLKCASCIRKHSISERIENRRMNEQDMGQKMVEKVSKRGYIMDNEIAPLKEFGFKITIENVPSVFIIAPKVLKNNEKIETVITRNQPKDPIILIKHEENDFELVHSWDNSQMLNERLVQQN